LIVGILLPLALRPKLDAAHEASLIEPSTAVATPWAEGVQKNDPRISALEQRLSILEAKPEQEAGIPSETPAAKLLPPSREEAEAELAKEKTDLFAKVASDPIDPSWGPKAGRDLRQNLEAAASSEGFEIRNVECKTTVCSAELQWPTYQDARTARDRLLTNPYSLNCTRTIFLPRPNDETRPYGSSLILDCEEFRARGN